MEVHWNGTLVALSVAIAVLASYTALDLAGRVVAARGRPRQMWLSGGAFAMGTGIWSMHFLGMLAWSVPVSLSYDVGLIVLSALFAIVGSGFALWVVGARGSNTARLALAAPVMGAAIAGMHYTGMAGLRGTLHIDWRPQLVILSIVIAVVASYGALSLAFRFREDNNNQARVQKLAASVVMGLAICGMHYTGMAAAHAVPGHVANLQGNVLPSGGLAAAVIAITLMIMGMSAVVATIDRQLSSTASLAAENERLYREAQAEIAERMRAELALRASEEELRQSQRIEAVGRLAGGIAHDFNNLLTAISGHAELLLAETPDTDSRRGDLVEIWRAADRAAALTGQLLAFSRKQVLKPQVIDLNTCVIATERMLRRLIGEHIEVTTDLAGDLDAVCADARQIEQVLLNLAVNARDAMPGGGRLHIRTANALSCPEYSGHLPDGKHVLLLVSDTGSGMDAETAAHIFDPFFTTKEQGKGTGLGLSTVYGIVRQSDGTIWVDTTPGGGSTFCVCLPAVKQKPDEDAFGPAVSQPSKGSETILLVEDEVPVRALVRKLLTRQGYTVLEATDVRDAIRIASEHHQAIDLMLTDVVMPVMNGPELASIITASRPTMRLLYMSGYTEGSVLHSFSTEGVELLAKPFTLDRLASKVREVMDQPAASLSRK